METRDAGQRDCGPGACEPPAPAAVSSDQYVLWAYRLLLGREPESWAAVTGSPGKDDRKALVRRFLSSAEYRKANGFEVSPAEPAAARGGVQVAADVESALDERVDEYALMRGYQDLDRDARAQVLNLVRELQGVDLARPWDHTPDRALRQSDVAALFRLILGRAPRSPREWGGHLAALGEDRDEVVRRYLASLEVSRRGLLERSAPSAVQVASFDGFSIYAASDDLATGRHILSGRYEPHVTAVFRKVLRPGMTVVDVGANIGFFTMLSASLVGAEGSVTAVEANPDNAKLLEASRRLNGFGQIRVACVAAARELGVILLKSDWSNGVTVKIKGDDELWASRLAPCLPLRDVLPAGRKLDFLKIDVEGAEHEALLGCREVLRRDRPVIVSEFSPEALPGVSGVDGETYLRFLLSCGLELSVIAPDGGLVSFGEDVQGVVDAWAATRSGHIDIVAAPGAAIL